MVRVARLARLTVLPHLRHARGHRNNPPDCFLRFAYALFKSRLKTKKPNANALNFFTGPSGETWTHGLLTPSQARSQLRHTRIAKGIISQFFCFCNSFFEYFWFSVGFCAYFKTDARRLKNAGLCYIIIKPTAERNIWKEAVLCRILRRWQSSRHLPRS